MRGKSTFLTDCNAADGTPVSLNTASGHRTSAPNCCSKFHLQCSGHQRDADPFQLNPRTAYNERHGHPSHHSTGADLRWGAQSQRRVFQFTPDSDPFPKTGLVAFPGWPPTGLSQLVHKNPENVGKELLNLCTESEELMWSCDEAKFCRAVVLYFDCDCPCFVV